jgi:succinate dehydrogenase/fumarate reductase flavoprotein subunit
MYIDNNKKGVIRMFNEEYDVIVVGAVHSGVEAALAAA